jgi:hypothetical protein
MGTDQLDCVAVRSAFQHGHQHQASKGDSAQQASLSYENLDPLFSTLAMWQSEQTRHK